MLLHEAELLLHHLLSQPFVAVDIDLDGERQPGLQANVDQSELGIEEVIVKHALLPGSTDELRSLGAWNEGKGRTGLQGAQDADKSCDDTLLADDALSPLVLAEVTGAIQVGAPGLASPILGVRDKAVGVLRSQGLHEVGAAHLQHAIDEVLELTRRRQGQMALEENAVKTGKHGDDQAGKLGDEARQRLHGVLLQNRAGANPILKAERRFCSSSLVAALPRWEEGGNNFPVSRWD